jgi:predicted DNA-binding protein (UPF0251 family)/predicted Fe-Mo cluster-binding NifX family protein
VNALPGVRFFKPQGIPARELEEVYLTFEGYEALRLADLEGLLQDEAADRMQISRQTFGRILMEARRAVAEAIVRGLVLRIEGGEYRMKNYAGRERTGSETFPSRVNTIRKSRERKEEMNKIAVSCTGPSLEGPVDPRFGRAAGFLIVNPDTMESEYINNAQSQAMSQGAGIQAAELMARHQVEAVLTGYVGPKAFQALSAVGIKVGQNLENLSVKEALDRYIKGQIPLATAPNRTGGRGRR